MKSHNRTVDRTLDIVEMLSLEEEGLPLNELIARLDIPASSAHIILQTLTDRGYLERTSEKRYRLSAKMFRIGSRPLDRLEVKAQALGYLRELTVRTGETSQLAILLDTELIFVERVESQHSIRASASIGTVLELHAPATGKALLAFLPKERRWEIMNRLRYTRYTPKTLSSAEALARELSDIRKRGFSVDDEEVTLGVRCIAAPVFDYSGAVVAAIGITGPTTRVGQQDVDKMARSVVDSARSFSRILGGEAAAN